MSIKISINNNINITLEDSYNTTELLKLIDGLKAMEDNTVKVEKDVQEAKPRYKVFRLKSCDIAEKPLYVRDFVENKYYYSPDSKKFAIIDELDYVNGTSLAKEENAIILEEDTNDVAIKELYTPWFKQYQQEIANQYFYNIVSNLYK